MRNVQDLTHKSCKPCTAGLEALTVDQVQQMISCLPSEWHLDADSSTISRVFKFKGFAKVVYLTNLLVYLADKEGHHPDVSFGWGYCRVVFTTHAVDGLSENDFICAQKLEKLIAI